MAVTFRACAPSELLVEVVLDFHRTASHANACASSRRMVIDPKIPDSYSYICMNRFSIIPYKKCRNRNNLELRYPFR